MSQLRDGTANFAVCSCPPRALMRTLTTPRAWRLAGRASGRLKAGDANTKPQAQTMGLATYGINSGLDRATPRFVNGSSQYRT